MDPRISSDRIILQPGIQIQPSVTPTVIAKPRIATLPDAAKVSATGSQHKNIGLLKGELSKLNDAKDAMVGCKVLYGLVGWAVDLALTVVTLGGYSMEMGRILNKKDDELTNIFEMAQTKREVSVKMESCKNPAEAQKIISNFLKGLNPEMRKKIFRDEGFRITVNDFCKKFGLTYIKTTKDGTTDAVKTNAGNSIVQQKIDPSQVEADCKMFSRGDLGKDMGFNPSMKARFSESLKSRLLDLISTNTKEDRREAAIMIRDLKTDKFLDPSIRNEILKDRTFVDRVNIFINKGKTVSQQKIDPSQVKADWKTFINGGMGQGKKLDDKMILRYAQSLENLLPKLIKERPYLATTMLALFDQKNGREPFLVHPKIADKISNGTLSGQIAKFKEKHSNQMKKDQKMVSSMTSEEIAKLFPEFPIKEFLKTGK